VDTWTHRYIDTNGIRMHHVEQGQGLPVVMCHGFPELWYSWRFQIPALAEAGFRAIAPDLRGYGETDKPEAVEEYDMHHLTGDLVGLLDAIGEASAVFVGHDWGGGVVWDMSLMHPERVAAVIALNTPVNSRGPTPPLEAYSRVPGGRFNYILNFQERDKPERQIEADIEGWLRSMMRIAVQQDFLTDEDIRVFADAFRKGGLSGPINYYRNIQRNWETTRHLAGRQVTCPALMICAAGDPVLLPSMTNGMERWVPKLQKHIIEDCGHWTQQEQPEQVNRLMIDFLRGLSKAG